MRPGSVLRSSKSELVREDGENPRQREQHKHNNERGTASRVQTWQLGTQVKGDTGQGMKRVSRDQLLQALCALRVTGANRLKKKSEMFMILFCKEHPGSSEDRGGEMRAWETSWQVLGKMQVRREA